MFAKNITIDGKNLMIKLTNKNYSKIIELPKLDSSLFTWLNWKAGSIHDLGLKCRYDDIISSKGKTILSLYAIGWCFGEGLLCRPKETEIALMCEKNDELFWFHLRNYEFLQVFKKRKIKCSK